MKPYLLDTNVLIALAWPNHVHYRESQAWFENKGAAGFRGFVGGGGFQDGGAAFGQ